MNIFDVAVVGIRLLAIWVMIQSLRWVAIATGTLVGMGSMSADGFSTTYAVMVGLSALLVGAIGVALFRFALPAARLIIPRHAEQEAPLSFQYEQLQTLGFVLLGTYLAATVIPGLLQNLLMIMEYSRIDSEGLSGWRGSEMVYRSIAAGVELAIALVLIFRARTLVALLARLRQAGVRKV